MLTEEAKGRLYNWKFDSAAELLTSDATEDEAATVKALRDLYGNIGWFYGSMAVLVGAAVASLGVTSE